jgi:hypothetical protein
MEKLIFLLTDYQSLLITILFCALSLVSGFFYIKFFKGLKKDKNTTDLFGFIFPLSGIGMGAITSALATVAAVYSFGNIFACALAIGLVVFFAFSGLFTDTPFVGCGLSISTGWFIGIGLMTGVWLLLIIATVLLGIGILCGYVYERKKTRKTSLA